MWRNFEKTLIPGGLRLFSCENYPFGDRCERRRNADIVLVMAETLKYVYSEYQ